MTLHVQAIIHGLFLSLDKTLVSSRHTSIFKYLQYHQMVPLKHENLNYLLTSPLIAPNLIESIQLFPMVSLQVLFGRFLIYYSEQI